MDGSAAPTQPCPNCGDTAILAMARQTSVENHHDENSTRPTGRKPVQRIQEEEGRTLQEYEEGTQRDLESENEANEEVEGRIKN